MGFIAPKGSGKTTLICNILMFYKGYFNKIIIFSPSVNADEKWDYIKKQPLLTENKKLKAFLARLRTERKRKGTVVYDPPINLELQDDATVTEKEFSPYIGEENFFAAPDDELLVSLMENQKKIIDFLKENGETKYTADRLLVIFDDMVGSELFRRSRTNPFLSFNTNHRHLGTSAIMISQAYKEITSTVRTNFTCMIIFEIANDAEVKKIYEENTVGLKEHAWLEVYNHCVSEPFGFMYFNHQKKKDVRVMKNFEKYINFET